MISLADLEASHFSPLIGKTFRLRIDASTSLDLQLIEAATAPYGRRKSAKRDPFFIRFKGLPGLRLQQGIYRLENDELGALDIFVVQIGDGAEGSEFESVFT